jgi:hypothetical protein
VKPHISSAFSYFVFGTTLYENVYFMQVGDYPEIDPLDEIDEL